MYIFEDILLLEFLAYQIFQTLLDMQHGYVAPVGMAGQQQTQLLFIFGKYVAKEDDNVATLSAIRTISRKPTRNNNIYIHVMSALAAALTWQKLRIHRRVCAARRSAP